MSSLVLDMIHSIPRRKQRRDNICDICQKPFGRLDNLKRHYRTHTGEKPHRCSYPGCHQSFPRSDQLNRHFSMHSTSSSTTTNIKKRKSSTDSGLDSFSCYEQPPPYSASISSNFASSPGPMAWALTSNKKRASMNVCQIQHILDFTPVHLVMLPKEPRSSRMELSYLLN